jgi:hypothetical protein
MPKEFEYKFVSVKLKGGWLTGRTKPEYRDTIVEHAQDGWRFVQAFAPGVGAVGESDWADLIFEREVGGC